MNNRTVRVLIVIALILIVAVAIAQVSGARRTGQYLQDLALQEPDKVMEAMTQLRERGASVGPRLAELVQAGDPQAAPRAAWLLGLVQSHAGDAVLQSSLTSENTVLRVAALQSLGQLKVEAAQPAITGMLADAEQKPEVRSSAAYALGCLGGEASVTALAKALSDRPAPVPPAPAAPAGAPAPAAPPPPPDTNLGVRLAAATALGVARDPGGIDALAATLKVDAEPSPEVRVAAANALADVAAATSNEEQAGRAINGLLDGLKDKVGDVRIAAAYSLGKATVPRSVEQQVSSELKTAFDDKHYWVRLAAKSSHEALKLP